MDLCSLLLCKCGLLIVASKWHSILKRRSHHCFFSLYWNISFFFFSQQQNFCSEVADLCQHYPEVWAEILIIPCACLLLPYSFSKCLMMAFPFQSNVVLIFMPCSEHPFCCTHLIKSNYKSNVLHSFACSFYILPGGTSAFTQGQTHSFSLHWSSRV